MASPEYFTKNFNPGLGDNIILKSKIIIIIVINCVKYETYISVDSVKYKPALKI